MERINKLVTLVSRTYATGPGSGPNVRVLVHDIWDINGLRVVNNWAFEFRPKAGDLRAQIDARLDQ